MIKGINRQIIELETTSSTYYEKAWLVIKPEYANMQQQLLEKEAKKMLKSLDVPSSMKFKRNFTFWMLRLGIAAVCGGALTLLIQGIIM